MQQLAIANIILILASMSLIGSFKSSLVTKTDVRAMNESSSPGFGRTTYNEFKNLNDKFVSQDTLEVTAHAHSSPVLVQQPGVRRTELQRYDLSAPGREVIQSRIDFDPGVAFANHSHPGEEIIYVIEGLFEYQVEGKPAVTLKAGDVLFIPAGVVHAAKNVGRRNAAELATYVVEKGKPLLVMAK